MVYLILLEAQQGNSFMSVGLMVAIGVVFYLFLIRPQQKKSKEQKQFVEEVKKGDLVVTIGGMHGRIADVDNNTFILEVDKGGRIKFNKSAISMESTKAIAGKK